MSQLSAVASASFARSSPRCQLWTSLPRFPSGFSRLWSGPATKPSSEIDMWQLVSGIGVLQVIAICKRRHRTAREMWWQSCKHHLRHRDASGQRTSLGLPDQRRLKSGDFGVSEMGDTGLELASGALVGPDSLVLLGFSAL